MAPPGLFWAHRSGAAGSIVGSRFRHLETLPGKSVTGAALNGAGKVGGMRRGRIELGRG